MTNKNIDIQSIVNEKVAEMLEKDDVVKRIEDNIEKAITSALDDAVSSYSVKRVLSDKIEKEVSENLKSLNFSAYTNKIVDNIAKVMEAEAGKDLTEKIIDTYKEFFEKKEEISIDEVVESYVEYLNESLDNSEKPDYYFVQLSVEDYDWAPNDYAKLSLQKEDESEQLGKKVGYK